MDTHYQDEDIKELLRSARTIAVVGLSPNEDRASNMVGRYLQDIGYRVIPVNPGQDQIFGYPCYPDIAAVPETIDIVNIFRPSEAVPPIVEQAIEIGAGAVWMQQGIVHEQAAQQSLEAGLACIMDRCIKVEYARLLA